MFRSNAITRKLLEFTDSVCQNLDGKCQNSLATRDPEIFFGRSHREVVDLAGKLAAAPGP